MKKYYKLLYITCESKIEAINLGKLLVKNKLAALYDICGELKIEINECAFMGDDLPDIEALSFAGIGLTVADAITEVFIRADWVSTRPGGQGAVREVCEIILQSIAP